MTSTTDRADQVTDRATGPSRRVRARVLAVLGAVAAAVAVWLLAELALGIDLQVTPGTDEPQPVGLGSVVIASLAASAAGWALLALLERRSARGRSAWVFIAVLALIVSFAPTLAGTTTAVTAALASMHLAVGAVLIPVLARTSPRAGRPADSPPIDP